MYEKKEEGKRKMNKGEKRKWEVNGRTKAK
jgi:hypothetical protein